MSRVRGYTLGRTNIESKYEPSGLVGKYNKAFGKIIDELEQKSKSYSLEDKEKVFSAFIEYYEKDLTADNIETAVLRILGPRYPTEKALDIAYQSTTDKSRKGHIETAINNQINGLDTEKAISFLDSDDLSADTKNVIAGSLTEGDTLDKTVSYIKSKDFEGLVALDEKIDIYPTLHASVMSAARKKASALSVDDLFSRALDTDKKLLKSVYLSALSAKEDDLDVLKAKSFEDLANLKDQLGEEFKTLVPSIDAAIETKSVADVIKLLNNLETSQEDFNLYARSLDALDQDKLKNKLGKLSLTEMLNLNEKFNRFEQDDEGFTTDSVAFNRFRVAWSKAQVKATSLDNVADFNTYLRLMPNVGKKREDMIKETAEAYIGRMKAGKPISISDLRKYTKSIKNFTASEETEMKNNEVAIAIVRSFKESGLDESKTNTLISRLYTEHDGTNPPLLSIEDAIELAKSTEIKPENIPALLKADPGNEIKNMANVIIERGNRGEDGFGIERASELLELSAKEKAELINEVIDRGGFSTYVKELNAEELIELSKENSLSSLNVQMIFRYLEDKKTDNLEEYREEVLKVRNKDKLTENISVEVFNELHQEALMLGFDHTNSFKVTSSVALKAIIDDTARFEKAKELAFSVKKGRYLDKARIMTSVEFTEDQMTGYISTLDANEVGRDGSPRVQFLREYFVEAEKVHVEKLIKKLDLTKKEFFDLARTDTLKDFSVNIIERALGSKLSDLSLDDRIGAELLRNPNLNKRGLAELVLSHQAVQQNTDSLSLDKMTQSLLQEYKGEKLFQDEKLARRYALYFGEKEGFKVKDKTFSEKARSFGRKFFSFAVDPVDRMLEKTLVKAGVQSEEKIQLKSEQFFNTYIKPKAVELKELEQIQSKQGRESEYIPGPNPSDRLRDVQLMMRKSNTSFVKGGSKKYFENDLSRLIRLKISALESREGRLNPVDSKEEKEFGRAKKAYLEKDELKSEQIKTLENMLKDKDFRELIKSNGRLGEIYLSEFLENDGFKDIDSLTEAFNKMRDQYILNMKDPATSLKELEINRNLFHEFFKNYDRHTNPPSSHKFIASFDFDIEHNLDPSKRLASLHNRYRNDDELFYDREDIFSKLNDLELSVTTLHGKELHLNHEHNVKSHFTEDRLDGLTDNQSKFLSDFNRMKFLEKEINKAKDLQKSLANIEREIFTIAGKTEEIESEYQKYYIVIHDRDSTQNERKKARQNFLKYRDKIINKSELKDKYNSIRATLKDHAQFEKDKRDYEDKKSSVESFISEVERNVKLASRRDGIEGESFYTKDLDFLEEIIRIGETERDAVVATHFDNERRQQEFISFKQSIEFAEYYGTDDVPDAPEPASVAPADEHERIAADGGPVSPLTIENPDAQEREPSPAPSTPMSPGSDDGRVAVVEAAPVSPASTASAGAGDPEALEEAQRAHEHDRMVSDAVKDDPELLRMIEDTIRNTDGAMDNREQQREIEAAIIAQREEKRKRSEEAQEKPEGKPLDGITRADATAFMDGEVHASASRSANDRTSEEIKAAGRAKGKAIVDEVRAAHQKSKKASMLSKAMGVVSALRGNRKRGSRAETPTTAKTTSNAKEKAK